MDSLISTFHIDWKIMIAQLINFAVVIIVLWIFALKPLKKLMDERGATIAGGLENAEKQKELLAKQKEDYDAALADARAQVAVMVKEGKKDADAVRVELIEKAQTEVAAIVAAGKKQADADRMKAMDEFKQEAVSIITAAAEKVMGETAVGKVESKLVEESIKNI